MKTIELKTPHGISKILIKEGLFNKIGELLKKEYLNSKIAIVTDDNLKEIYGEKLTSILPNALILNVPAGEESKCFDVTMSLAKQLLDAEFTRSDVVIGFGGGMVTDLAGFVASVYMRGIKYIAIPTSLLGMVDAAIGGKTGIDFHGKNLIGTFYLADYVLMDPDMLKSFLYINKSPGWGEAIKYAAIYDASLFNDLKKDPLDLKTIIQKSAQAKVNVVSQDLIEGGIRKTLNYGHTFGHAIETATNYEMSHDQGISIGMVLSNKIAQNLGKQDEKVGEKIKSTLQQFDLPTELPPNLTLDGLVDLIKKDKKRKGDKISFIIVPELGKTEIIPMKPEELVKLAQ